MSERKNGVVKWFNTSKGYGFIQPEDGGDDVFIHVSALPEGSLVTEGDKLSFEVEVSRRGGGKLQACNVQSAGP